jgi:hypothetical protein
MRRAVLVLVLLLSVVVLAAGVGWSEGCAPLPGDRSPFIDCPPPLVMGGAVMIPMRPMFTFMAATVQFWPETGAIQARAFDRTITMWLGNTQARVAERLMTMQVPPTEVNGSTYIPLRFIATALGATVGWDENSKTVTVCYCRRKGTMKVGERGISAVYCG